MEISLELEAASLMITLLLLMLHVDRQQRSNLRYQLFNLSLILSASAILLNLLSSWGINNAATLPLWLNNSLGMAYFLAQHASFSLMTGYGFYLLNEHVPDRRCFRLAVSIIAGLGVLLEVLVLFNPWTRWFFAFEGSTYVRGPANKLGFVVLGAELVMATVCYLRNRRLVSRAIHRLMYALPPLTLMLLLVQTALPDVMIVGMASAVVNLIFFISFQSSRIGQDSLTELPNRYAFFQSLAARLRKKSRTHLIVVYLERFEEINRKYGTHLGDVLLYMAAREMDRFAPRYQAFRLSNTRFVLMGDFVGQREAEATARALHERFCEPWRVAGVECLLETSIAHMVTDESMRDENEVAEELEYTLSQSREAQGSLVFYDDRLRAMYRRRLYVLSQVRLALERDSFEVYYQPIYDCRSGRIISAESLLRLFDDQGEPISPGEFIPLAEKNGLIDEISWMVIRKVCQFLSEHPDLPLDSISVNMPEQQLTDRSFLRRLHNCRAQYGVRPEQLCIEITERTISEKPGLVRAVMAQLAAEGVHFYLDDFGIGYSNLASMLELPFETVKLDASLIRSIAREKDGKGAVTMRLLAQMMHSAGFTVVAEGVERADQVERVKALGIDRIQGFYYARPMPGDQLAEFLATKRLVLMKNETMEMA